MARAIVAIISVAAALMSHQATAASPLAEEETAEPLADELAVPYTVILSLEPLFALGPYTQGGDSGHGGFSIGLGPYLRTLNDEHRRPFLPHLAPRLAADVVLPEGITLGLGAGFGLSVAEVETQSGSDETRTHQSSTALVLTRLGYVTAVGPNSAFWPRVGLSHAWGSGEDPSGYYASDVTETWSRNTQLDINMEFAFVVTRHVALTLGFFAAVGLDGTIGTAQDSLGTTRETETRRLHDGFGAALGLLGYL